MNNILKKVLGIVLAAGLLAGSMTACGDNSGTVNGSTGSVAGSDAGTGVPSEAVNGGNFQKDGLPIVNEPVTLDILTVRWPDMDDSFKENNFLKELEGKTNVKIDWQVRTNTDWDTKKKILLASRNLPGLMLGDLTVFDTDVLDNIEYFLPLDDLIENYMPNYKNAIKENPYMKKYVTYPDGKIYSMCSKLPARSVCANQPVINKAWLDRLGLQIPDNIDELYNVLKLFKQKDANGNGDPNDEIPYTGCAENTLFDPSILILFGINESEFKYMSVNNGVPEFYPISEQFKDAVKMLNKWYAEGIMDKEYFTQNSTMMKAKYESKPTRVGFCYSWTADSNFNARKEEYVVIPPITGPDGKKYAAGNPNGVSCYRRMGLEITKFCKYPEVAARWADQFYTNEASIQNYWGAIGTVITKNEDGTYQLNNPPEGTSADLWYWNQSLRDFGPKYVSPEFEKNLILPKDGGDGLKLELDKLGRDYVIEPYPSVMLTKEESENVTAMKADIEKYVQTNSAKWITKGGIDEDWDSYVKKLYDMKLDQWVSIYTDAYNRFQGKNE